MNNQVKSEKWLSLAQTMEYIQCSKTSVYNVAKRYNIRQSKFLSMPYFSKEDIDRAWEENAVPMGMQCN